MTQQGLLKAYLFAGLTIAITTLTACSSTPLQPLPVISGSTSIITQWQASLSGKQFSALVPAVLNGKVYAAHPNGNLLILDEDSGAELSRIELKLARGTQLSGGVAAHGDLIIIGSNKGDVLALDVTGSTRWTKQISREILAPAAISENTVVVLSGDGYITGLDIKNGERKWTIQRTLPALTIRSSAIPIIINQGAGFVGTPQGKLLGFDTQTGIIGWEATVATPHGTSELERLVDIVGRPALDTNRICASAYHGHVACFDLSRGTLLWSRDISSLINVVLDDQHVYATDDKGTVYALDKSTGGTSWMQNALAGRTATGAALLDDYYALQDNEGNLHLLERKTGKISGRGLGSAQAATAGLVQTERGLLLQTNQGEILFLQAR